MIARAAPGTFVAMVCVALVALAALVLAPAPALAHGYVSSPLSRQAQCRAGAVAGCGAIIYEPQSVEAPKGLRSCNGGVGNWAPLADESKAWPVTSLSAGVNTFRWTLTAVHPTASWEYYIGNTRIALISGSSTTHSVNLAGYSGRQKILAIWNIGDTANAFYNCIDVNIGGGGGGGGSTPTTAPTTAPTTRPTTSPTTAPTTRPTTTPTTSPTSTPISGTSWYTVKLGDSLGAIAASRRITLAALLKVNPEITDPNLIYVSQRIRVPSGRTASGLNDTDGGNSFGLTGAETGVEETLTDNAVDLTSTGVGSHWWAGIQKQLHASSAPRALQSATTVLVGVTLVGVAALMFGQ